MIREDQDFSQEVASEDEWDKYVYGSIMQKKCGSDAVDEMESADDLGTIERCNSEQGDTFSVDNNVGMMNESWNHFDSDDHGSFSVLDYNTQLKQYIL